MRLHAQWLHASAYLPKSRSDTCRRLLKTHAFKAELSTLAALGIAHASVHHQRELDIAKHRFRVEKRRTPETTFLSRCATTEPVRDSFGSRSRPSYRISPFSGRTRPTIDFINTVFPEPLCPIIRFVLPVSNVALTPLST